MKGRRFPRLNNFRILIFVGFQNSAIKRFKGNFNKNNPRYLHENLYCFSSNLKYKLTPMLSNQLSQLNEIQRYNLLISLALNVQTRANHFETHTPTDALIDLRNHYFLTHDEQLFQVVQSLNTLTQLEVLNLLIDLANQLKGSAIQKAFSVYTIPTVEKKTAVYLKKSVL